MAWRREPQTATLAPFTPPHIAMTQAEEAEKKKDADEAYAVEKRKELDDLNAKVRPPPHASCFTSSSSPPEKFPSARFRV
jgi:hypothetical protein